jgi:hypothetical protein
VIVECAWCGCVLGEKDGLGLSGKTSGICQECLAAISGDLSPAPCAREGQSRSDPSDESPPRPPALPS